MGTATDPHSRQRSLDFHAERSYWLLHLDTLPHHERFTPAELMASVTLGLEATHRGQPPAKVADALMTCFTRLVPKPIASAADIMAVMTAVWEKTFGAPTMARRYVIELERFGPSLLNLSSFDDVALAYMESVQGVENVRVEPISDTRIRLTYEWADNQALVVPTDHLDGYGLRIALEE